MCIQVYRWLNNMPRINRIICSLYQIICYVNIVHMCLICLVPKGSFRQLFLVPHLSTCMSEVRPVLQSICGCLTFGGTGSMFSLSSFPGYLFCICCISKNTRQITIWGKEKAQHKTPTEENTSAHEATHVRDVIISGHENTLRKENNIQEWRGRGNNSNEQQYTEDWKKHPMPEKQGPPQDTIQPMIMNLCSITLKQY